MEKVVYEMDFKSFRDEGLLEKFGTIGKALSFVYEKGIYEGRYLTRWLRRNFKNIGVNTFADLKLSDKISGHLPPEQRYKLVVVAADISRGKLIYLPWDYPEYGLDPDKQSVAKAVRASMSIPFYFEPVRLKGSYLVDGGLLSNFPVDIFDDTQDWPTFGIKLSARPGTKMVKREVSGPFGFVTALVSTMHSAHDHMHLDDPSVVDRTIFIDSGKIQNLDVFVTDEQKKLIFDNGRDSAIRFLARWNYETYKKKYISD
jgi:NTE family protein